MNKDDLAFDHNDLIQPKRDSKYTNFEEANFAAWAYAAALLNNFPSLQPIQELSNMGASLESVAKAALDNEIDLDPFADILSSEETKMPEKLDPCREVTYKEWGAAYHEEGCESYAETATHLIRYRVTEALADTVARADYEDVVRRLAKIAHRYANPANVNHRLHSDLYTRLCENYGVDPAGGEK